MEYWDWYPGCRAAEGSLLLCRSSSMRKTRVTLRHAGKMVPVTSILAFALIVRRGDCFYPPLSLCMRSANKRPAGSRGYPCQWRSSTVAHVPCTCTALDTCGEAVLSSKEFPRNSRRRALSRRTGVLGAPRRSRLMSETAGGCSGAILNEHLNEHLNEQTAGSSRNMENDGPRPHRTLPQQANSTSGWNGEIDEIPGTLEEGDDDGRQTSGTDGGIGMGSAEFVNLVKAQFDLLATMLDASQIVLFVRRENTATGALEFIPAMVHPERARVWVMGADGMTVQEPPKELPWTESAADVLPSYPFISVRKRGDEWETPNATENDDGGLSAPLMYASLVVGMITVWKKDRRIVEGAEGGEGGEGKVSAEEAVWDDRDKDLLEKIASSVAMAAVLDQKQRWAAVVQVEQLRRVLSESLHQVKNPMTALRTFGKLLLRRLPKDDTLNRELAKDIILQSDRLVDLLLPVDSVVGLLAQAVESVESTGTMGGAAGESLTPSTPAAYDSVDEATGEALSLLEQERRGETLTRNVRQEVQDALLSPSEGPPFEALGKLPDFQPAPMLEEMNILFVQDVIEPVTRAAQAVAQARRVGFRWRVDEDLPGVIGNDRALEEALSNVVENALKYCKMGTSTENREHRAMVVLRARPSTVGEWGVQSGVVIEVVDNGPGIDQDDLPHIFDRGFRGRQPRESSIPGTGLGLGIAREIMRSMGGDVKVENKINQDKGHWGAGVKLFLPRRAREGE